MCALEGRRRWKMGQGRGGLVGTAVGVGLMEGYREKEHS
jgi:hypothetical protein